MPEPITRRTVLAGASILVAAPWAVRSAAAQPPSPAPLPDSFPSNDPTLVREIVGAAHRDLARVKELLTATPALANASWDAGFGDWETPLGAASHVGRREIALLLLGHGARPDIFTFAMLGHLTAVRAMIEAHPALERTRGPHGLTLAHHARAGGDEANAVAEYLKTLEGADIPYTDLPLDDAAKAQLVGEYTSTTPPHAGTRLTVKLPPKGGRLTIERTGAHFPPPSPRTLFHQGNTVFHPAGAPEVRMTFQTRDGSPPTLRFTSSGIIWEGRRV